VLTYFQQIIAGDSWGQVCVPIIEEAPVTFVFFLSVFVSVALTMMNLILAVIVESSMESRTDDLHDQAVNAEKEKISIKERLLEYCKQMDTNCNGSICMEELLIGVKDCQEFCDALTTLGIGQEDLAMVFNVLDDDLSGEVEYKEFVEQLYRLKSNPIQLALFYITQLKKGMFEMEAMKDDVGHIRECLGSKKSDGTAPKSPTASTSLRAISLSKAIPQQKPAAASAEGADCNDSHAEASSKDSHSSNIRKIADLQYSQLDDLGALTSSRDGVSTNKAVPSTEAGTSQLLTPFTEDGLPRPEEFSDAALRLMDTKLDACLQMNGDMSRTVAEMVRVLYAYRASLRTQEPETLKAGSLRSCCPAKGLRAPDAPHPPTLLSSMPDPPPAEIV
jgi:Ca2+-binding EF-hand superfamily protein